MLFLFIAFGVSCGHGNKKESRQNQNTPPSQTTDRKKENPQTKNPADAPPLTFDLTIENEKVAVEPHTAQISLTKEKAGKYLLSLTTNLADSTKTGLKDLSLVIVKNDQELKKGSYELNANKLEDCGQKGNDCSNIGVATLLPTEKAARESPEETAMISQNGTLEITGQQTDETGQTISRGKASGQFSFTATSDNGANEKTVKGDFKNIPTVIIVE